MYHRKAPFIPQSWLMCDARLGERLPNIIAAMPPRSAVVVRPYAMERHGLAPMIRNIRRIARAKLHILLLSGRGPATGYDGRYGLTHRGKRARVMCLPVHNAYEARRARRMGADTVLVSPIWPTQTHADATGIGVALFEQLARQSGCPAIALGGMNAARFRLARRHGAYGWAAIDAWLPK